MFLKLYLLHKSQFRVLYAATNAQTQTWNNNIKPNIKLFQQPQTMAEHIQDLCSDPDSVPIMTARKYLLQPGAPTSVCSSHRSNQLQSNPPTPVQQIHKNGTVQTQRDK